jgi:predicted nucleic acid-binding protein
VSSSSDPVSEKEPAVFDASPLVFFDVLGYADLLPELHQVLVPPAVVEEVIALPGEPGSGIPEEEWVERRAPRVGTLRKIESEMTEGRGEKAAIALALDLSALIVLDDKRARNCAARWIAANRYPGPRAETSPPGACLTEPRRGPAVARRG